MALPISNSCVANKCVPTTNSPELFINGVMKKDTFNCICAFLGEEGQKLREISKKNCKQTKEELQVVNAYKSVILSGAIYRKSFWRLRDMERRKNLVEAFDKRVDNYSKLILWSIVGSLALGVISAIGLFYAESVEHTYRIDYNTKMSECRAILEERVLECWQMGSGYYQSCMNKTISLEIPQYDSPTENLGKVLPIVYHGSLIAAVSLTALGVLPVVVKELLECCEMRAQAILGKNQSQVNQAIGEFALSKREFLNKLQQPSTHKNLTAPERG